MTRTTYCNLNNITHILKFIKTEEHSSVSISPSSAAAVIHCLEVLLVGYTHIAFFLACMQRNVCGCVKCIEKLQTAGGLRKHLLAFVLHTERSCYKL